MCLINIKNKNGKIDDPIFENAIHNGFHTNSHGAGFAIWHKKLNAITLSKGYMGHNDTIINKFINDINSKILSDDDIVVTHHRSSTGGTVSQVNCHPFVITKDTATIRKLDLEDITMPVLAHNGIINQYAYGDDMCDTYHFANDFMSIPANYKLFVDNTPEFQKEYQDVLSWSRLAVLDPMLGLIISGSGWVYNGDFIFSGESYKNRSYFDVGGIGKLMSNVSTPVKTLELIKPINETIADVVDAIEVVEEEVDNIEFSINLPQTYTTNYSKFLEFINSKNKQVHNGGRTRKQVNTSNTEGKITLDDLYPTKFNKNELIYTLQGKFRNGVYGSTWLVDRMNNTSVDLKPSDGTYNYNMQNVDYADLWKHFTISVEEGINIPFYDSVLKMLNHKIGNKLIKRIVTFLDYPDNKRPDSINIPNIGNQSYDVINEYYEQRSCMMADLYKAKGNHKEMILTEDSTPEEESAFWNDVFENHAAHD